MPKSIAIKTVSVDFVSQLSDLRKREEHLWDHMLFNTSEGTPEYNRTKKELKRTRNALACLDGLEVSPD